MVCQLTISMGIKKKKYRNIENAHINCTALYSNYNRL